MTITATSTTGGRIWRKRAASGHITHAQAVQFCHAIYPTSRGGYARGKRCNITQAEARDVVDTMLEVRPLVDEQASERGRRWLAANAARFGLPKWNYHDIVDFRFVDVHQHPGGYYASYGPVYEARWADGRTLEYAPSAWQAGMNNERAATALWFDYKEGK